MNWGVPDPDWKRNPDIVAEESNRTRYREDDEGDEEEEDEYDRVRD